MAQANRIFEPLHSLLLAEIEWIAQAQTKTKNPAKLDKMCGKPLTRRLGTSSLEYIVCDETLTGCICRTVTLKFKAGDICLYGGKSA